MYIDSGCNILQSESFNFVPIYYIYTMSVLCQVVYFVD